MKSFIILSNIVALIACFVRISATVESNEIYSIDWLEDEELESLTVNEDKKIVIKPQNSSDGRQRFIARLNGGQFTLFSEVQPWEWVDHIVESSKTVNIQVTPQVLDVIGGTGEVLEGDYRNDNAQKWYIVPTGDDPNEGLFTNLLTRLCLAGNGNGEPLHLNPCNFSDVNQHFRLTKRTQGRCY